MIASLLSSVAFATLITLSAVHGSAVPASSSIFARKVHGINDRGDSRCVRYHQDNMERLQKATDLIEPDTVFYRGEKIACASYVTEGGAICAFLCDDDNSAFATVKPSNKSDDIIRNGWVGDKKTNFGDIIGDLRYIGAKGCGTAPLNRTINDNDNGCMKVNYVTDPCEASKVAGQPCRLTDPPKPVPG
ncbi:hypothetical protein XPA_003928 [Xanthoria parietina]